MYEHIGRLEKVGLGKESTPGTSVAASVWIPKVDGSFAPEVTKAKDMSAYGTIDELRDSQTTKILTKTEIKGIMRDIYGGHLLMAAFGQDTVVHKMTMAGGSGTFTVGENVSQAVSAATGVVKRVEGSTVYISVSTGVFTSGSNLVTGGTSSATGTPTFDSGVRNHFFQRLNSNAHPSYTIYGVDDVGTYKSTYSMLEQLEIECSVGDFLKFSAQYKGKKEVSGSASPAFNSSENAFLAKHATVKVASALSGLAGASAIAVSSFKLTIQKNLEDYQALGSVDINSIFNKQFKVVGELTAMFNATTLKDLVLNSTKQAMRIDITNTDASIGSSSNPQLTLDLAQCSFENWSKKAGNDDLVMQTVGFNMEFSITDSEGIIAFLRNTQLTAY